MSPTVNRGEAAVLHNDRRHGHHDHCREHQHMAYKRNGGATPRNVNDRLRGGGRHGFWRLQGDARAIYQSHRAQQAVCALIISNFLLIIVQAQIDPNKENDKAWRALDGCFTLLFSLELALNMYGSMCIDFFTAWNLFDVFVVLVGLLDLLAVPLPGWSNCIKLGRTFRVFRIFARVEEMNNIISSLLSAVPGMLHAFTICFVVMIIYALLALQFFGTPPAGRACTLTARGRCYELEYYGNFGNALYTMFQIMTGDSWSETAVRPLMFGEFGATWWKHLLTAIFFVSFILIVATVLLNVVLGVLLENMAAASALRERKQAHACRDKLRMREEMKKDFADIWSALGVHEDFVPRKVLDEDVMSDFFARHGIEHDCIDMCFFLIDRDNNGSVTVDEMLSFFGDLLIENPQQHYLDIKLQMATFHHQVMRELMLLRTEVRGDPKLRESQILPAWGVGCLPEPRQRGNEGPGTSTSRRTSSVRSAEVAPAPGVLAACAVDFEGTEFRHSCSMQEVLLSGCSERLRAQEAQVACLSHLSEATESNLVSPSTCLVGRRDADGTRFSSQKRNSKRASRRSAISDAQDGRPSLIAVEECSEEVFIHFDPQASRRSAIGDAQDGRPSLIAVEASSEEVLIDVDPQASRRSPISDAHDGRPSLIAVEKCSEEVFIDVDPQASRRSAISEAQDGRPSLIAVDECSEEVFMDVDPQATIKLDFASPLDNQAKHLPQSPKRKRKTAAKEPGGQSGEASPQEPPAVQEPNFTI